MTNEDTAKLMTGVHNKLFSDFGLMSDLPYELANTVANVYWRYFQQKVDSAPHITIEELTMRAVEFNGIKETITKFRLMPSEGVHQSLIDYMAEVILSAVKYRIPDFESKSLLRCKIERMFRKSQDIPNLVKVLRLYNRDDAHNA